MYKAFDYSKLKSTTWAMEVLNYIRLIHEYKGRQELYLVQMPDELSNLVALVKI